MRKIICLLMASTMLCGMAFVGCEYNIGGNVSPSDNISPSDDVSPSDNVSPSENALSEYVPHKFGKSDLNVLSVNGNITLGMSIKDVKKKLGEPESEQDKKISDSAQLNAKQLVYGDLTLTFFGMIEDYILGSIETTSENDVFAGGLHVGSTSNEVLTAFTTSDEKAPLYFSTDAESYGDYVYGSFNSDEFYELKPEGEIQYAYINNLEANEGISDEYTIEYYYYDPLKWNDTGYTAHCYSLIFKVDKPSEQVKSVSLEYHYMIKGHSNYVDEIGME